MAYAIFRTEKVKTSRELQSRYNHNFRIYDVANADPERKNQNLEPVDICGKTYERVVEEEITRLKMEGTIRKAVRSDAVRGIEVMLSYSADHDIGDLDEWVNKNVEWLNKTFNPPEATATFTDPETGDIREIKTNNVKSVVVHMDEAVPHIHAFVVPIDDKGHLNAKYYTTDRVKMKQLQTDYARAMKSFGLQRGVENTTTTHKEVSDFRKKIKESLSAELPMPDEHETILEYRTRMQEYYRTERAKHAEDVRVLNKKIDNLSGEITRIYDEKNMDQQKTGKQIMKLCSEIGLDNADAATIKKVRRVLAQQKDVEEAMRYYPDQDKYNKIIHDYAMLADYGRKKKREIEEKKKAKSPD